MLSSKWGATPTTEAEENNVEILDETMSNLVDAYGMDVVRDSLRRCRKSIEKELERAGSEASFSSIGSSGSASSDENSRTGARKLLQRSREMLRRSQRLTQGCLDASFDPIFAIDQYGGIIMVNKAAETQFQWSQEEFLGQNISIIAGGHHAERHDSYIDAYLKTGNKKVMGMKRALPAKRKDGTQFPIELGLAEIKSQEGEERLFCGFIRDLTAQKEFEAEIKRGEQNALRDHQITMGIIDSSFEAMITIDENATILMVNEAAVEQFGWSREEMLGKNIGMIVGGGHAENHDEYLRTFLRTGIKKVLGQRRELSARRRDGSEFPIELGLTEAKTQSGTGARIFCGFIRNLTAQKEFEAEIKRKEQKLLRDHQITMGIIDSSFEAMITIDETATILMVNEAAVEQFGWSREEMLGKNIRMVVGGAHAENHDEYLLTFLRTGIKKVMGKRRELPARRRDGSEFPIELGLTEAKTQSGTGARIFCGFIRDLTAQKEFEAEIKCNEQKLLRDNQITMGIIDSSFEAMITIDETATILMVNEAAVEQFGWSREEMLGKNIRMIVGGAHAENHDEYLRTFLRTGIKKVMGKRRELPARRRDGSEFPIELGLTEAKTQSGTGARIFCGFIRDLTAQKEFEAEIKRKEQKLVRDNQITMGIIDSSFEAMITIDETATILMVNEAAVEQFGWSREEMLGKNIRMIVGGAHAENHDEYLRTFLRTSIKKVMGKRRELPARRRDGSEFPIELGLTEAKTQVGMGVRIFCGFIRDLTAQKEFEAEIKRKEQKLVRDNQITMGIIDSSFEAMITIDETATILMVNEAAVEQFGWSREEMLGKNIRMLVGGAHAENHDEYLRTFLRTGIKKVMGKRRELLARRRDGSEFPIELGLTEAKTQSGTGARIFCGFIRDLTAQKEFEAEIKCNEQKLLRDNQITMGIIDSSFEAMITIDETATILMVNEAAVEQFGWSREEMLGKNIRMIVGGAHAENHDEYLRTFLRTGIKKVMGKRRELPARRRDGSEFPIELGLTEAKTQSGTGARVFCGFIRDLTAQKEFEAEIKRKEQKLVRDNQITMGIIDSSFEAMITIDETATILMVNEAAVEQFGWSREEMLGKNIRMIVGGAHAENHDEYLRTFLRTGIKKVMGKRRELPARRRDGSEFPIELGLTEAKTQVGMGVRIFCGFIRDMTAQKAFEAEIERKQQITLGIIEASSDSMFAVNGDGIIQMVNQAACDNFEWAREELMGQNIKIIVGPDTEGKHDDYIARYLETGIKKMIGSKREVLAYRKTGSTFPAVLSLADVTQGGSRLFVAFIRDVTDEKRLNEIEIEKKAAEALLLNMLPEDIATRLTKDPSHIADQHKVATILFADIVGFTQMSSTMTPVELVKILNDLFSLFDDLVDKYQLNKVKTIGDCYMVTSVPGQADESEQKDGCSRVCYFAVDMIDALHGFNCDNPERNLNLRVGVNAGPVVAGVVGTKRFLYDLWGDSVNLASRMESTGIPGRVQVSTNIVDLVGDQFEFESRGKIPIKGKGDMETFLLVKQLKECRLPKDGRHRSRTQRMSLYKTLAALSRRGFSSDNDFLATGSRNVMDGIGGFLEDVSASKPGDMKDENG